MTDDDLSTTELLGRMVKGDRGAADLVYDRVAGDLRRRAQRLMRDQKAGHTLQATALVNEAWLKIAGRETDWECRSQFLRTAAKAMRCILVDHARARMAVKRGKGEQAVRLEGDVASASQSPLKMLMLDEALTLLGERDPQLAALAELRLFGGLDHSECARALGISMRSSERLWKQVREFLREHLDPA